jgi:hopanoid-associated phosphorylase
LTTLRSGADAALLRVALERVMEEPYAAVVSFGLAGGLSKALRPGDLVIGDAAFADGARFPTDSSLTALFQEGLAGAGGKVAVGPVAGVDAPVLDVPAKALLRAETGALAVDMESHICAAFAARRGLRFAIIRVVSDPASRALPPLVTEAIKPDGRVAVARVLQELAGDPAQIGDLMRAGLDARAAFRTLRRCGSLLSPLLRLVLADL